MNLIVFLLILICSSSITSNILPDSSQDIVKDLSDEDLEKFRKFISDNVTQTKNDNNGGTPWKKEVTIPEPISIVINPDPNGPNEGAPNILGPSVIPIIPSSTTTPKPIDPPTPPTPGIPAKPSCRIDNSTWRTIRTERNPTVAKGERYFFAESHDDEKLTYELKLNSDQVKVYRDNEDKTLKRLQVRFDYWTYANPSAVAIGIWSELCFAGDKIILAADRNTVASFQTWHPFSHEITDPKLIQGESCRGDVQLKIELQYDSYVAIKNFKVIFEYDDKTTPVTDAPPLQVTSAHNTTIPHPVIPPIVVPPPVTPKDNGGSTGGPGDTSGGTGGTETNGGGDAGGTSGGTSGGNSGGDGKTDGAAGGSDGTNTGIGLVKDSAGNLCRPDQIDDTTGHCDRAKKRRKREAVVTPTEKVEIECSNPDECSKNFKQDLTSSKFIWSKSSTAPVGEYIEPKDTSSAITIKCYNMYRQDEMIDPEFSFRYYINSDAARLVLTTHDQIEVKDNQTYPRRNEYLVLHKTIGTSSDKSIGYQTATFRLSDFHPAPKDITSTDMTEVKIRIIPVIEDSDAIVALEKFPSDATPHTLKTSDKSDYLTATNDTKNSLMETKKWTQVMLPQERFSTSANSIEFNLVNIAKDTQYVILSPWIWASQQELTLSLDYLVTVDVENVNQTILIEFKVVEKSGNEWITVGSIHTVSLVETPSKGVISLKVPKGDTSKNRRVLIDIRSDPDDSRSKITFSNLQLGDPCLNPDVCSIRSKESTCQRLSGNTKNCICDKTSYGDLCQYEEFCETQKMINTNLNGFEWCNTTGNGVQEKSCQSVPNQYSNGLQFQCICDPKHYWDISSFRCKEFSECSKLLKCPEPNTKCVEENFDKNKPCPVCMDGYEKDSLGNCHAKDICKSECGDSMGCRIEGSGSSRVARCYCPSGFRQVDSKCISVNGCPEIFRVSAGCSHNCQIDTSNPRKGLSVKCTCEGYPGWSLENDNKTCVASEEIRSRNCSVASAGSVPTVSPDTTPETSDRCIWVCAPGYQTLPDGSCRKINYCSDESKKSEIITFCGYGVDSCMDNGPENMTCNCPIGYDHEDIVIGTNNKFGCVRSDPCLSLEEEDKREGQVCQIIRDVKAPFTKAVWSCEPGYLMDPDTDSCRKQCEIKENIVKCVTQNKVCKDNPRSSQPSCVCQPGYIERFSGRESKCEISSQSFKTSPLKFAIRDTAYLTVNGPLLKRFKRQSDGDVPSDDPVTTDTPGDDTTDPYVSSCWMTPDPEACIEMIFRTSSFVSENKDVIEYNKKQLLQQELGKGMDIVFRHIPGYETCDILSEDDILTDDDRKYSNVQVVLTFGPKIGQEILAKPTTLIEPFKEKCVTSYSGDDYCVLPEGLHISRAEIAKDAFKPSVLNPCTEDKVKYCSEGSECKSSNQPRSPFYYKCECPLKGYTIENVISQTLPIGISAEVTKMFCADIDECKRGECQGGNFSSCHNLPGDYTCSCIRGNFYDQASRVCVDVCSRITCENDGDCVTHPTRNDTHVCKCADCYHGDFCQLRDPKCKALTAGVISASVILGLALILAILIGVVCYRRKKQEADLSSREAPRDFYASSRPDVNDDHKNSFERQPSDKRPHKDTHF